MFPAGPRRPMPPFQPGPPRRPIHGYQQPNRPSFMSQFQTPEGRWDFDKISATAQQMHGIYNQVSPMVSPLITKLIKR